jgi:tRNA splicing ligase
MYITLTICLLSISPKWQKAVGASPIVGGVGGVGCGKTTASKVALALTGGWPQLFFSLFTDKVCINSLNSICKIKECFGTSYNTTNVLLLRSERQLHSHFHMVYLSTNFLLTLHNLVVAIIAWL